MSAKSRIIGSIAAGTVALGTLGAAAVTVSAPAAAQAAVVQSVVVKSAPVFGAWHRMTITLNGTAYKGYWLFLNKQPNGQINSGWLYDPNLPAGQQYLAVHGNVDGSSIFTGQVVMFEVKYPAGGPQGIRGFVGTVSPAGISGHWTELGPEAGNGTFHA
jgi:hypothetical protein